MILPPIDTSGENVLTLPVKPREPVAERFLVEVAPGKCRHWNGPFTVDTDAGKCFCRTCNEEVSPIFVLKQLMQQESRWMQSRESYLGEMKRLAERSRTKCDHCGQMTRVSHK